MGTGWVIEDSNGFANELEKAMRTSGCTNVEKVGVFAAALISATDVENGIKDGDVVTIDSSLPETTELGASGVEMAGERIYLAIRARGTRCTILWHSIVTPNPEDVKRLGIIWIAAPPTSPKAIVGTAAKFTSKYLDNLQVPVAKVNEWKEYASRRMVETARESPNRHVIDTLRIGRYILEGTHHFERIRNGVVLDDPLIEHVLEQRPDIRERGRALDIASPFAEFSAIVGGFQDFPYLLEPFEGDAIEALSLDNRKLVARVFTGCEESEKHLELCREVVCLIHEAYLARGNHALDALRQRFDACWHNVLLHGMVECFRNRHEAQCLQHLSDSLQASVKLAIPQARNNRRKYGIGPECIETMAHVFEYVCATIDSARQDLIPSTVLRKRAQAAGHNADTAVEQWLCDFCDALFEGRTPLLRTMIEARSQADLLAEAFGAAQLMMHSDLGNVSEAILPELILARIHDAASGCMNAIKQLSEDLGCPPLYQGCL